MMNIKFLIGLLVLVPFITSCSDDDDDGLSFSPNSVDIVVGQDVKVTVNNGAGTYTATADGKIAKVEVNAKELTITGVTIGTTIVNVKDKSGTKGVIKVSVKKDPYAELKADATTRFIWDGISRIKGTDAGIYTLSRVSGKVEFKYTSKDGKNTIVLSFNNPPEPRALTDFKLLIDGKETKVDAMKIVQIKKSGVNAEDTFWIVFNAGKKEGVCVATISE